MPALLIEPTDVIDVSFVPILLYGGPGCGKTSIAQTASNPLTLDFDEGIHRAFNRKRALRFKSWRDNIEAAGPNGIYRDPRTNEPIPYDSIIIDTGGRALDSMIPEILAENAKNGYAGNLSPQGWGILGNRFTVWLKTVRSWGKQVVMICHQEESKSASGDPYFLPDLPGKMSYKEMHKSFDLIGRIRYDGQTKYLDFNPSENAVAKNAAGWEAMAMPKLEASPHFLADLIADAKTRIGKTAEASAALAKAVDDWATRLESLPDVAAFNDAYSEARKLQKPLKIQVMHLFKSPAEQHGLAYDRQKECFVVKAGLPQEQPA